ncbi:hypothetical protein E3Q00_03565 [Wallemia mellicola]|nr:hypothetical protein E3Q00_03565 [Wallemia mellicola]
MSKLRKGIVYSVTEWAERHKNDFPKLVKKYDFDPKTFESSIEIAAALPFSIVGSMDSARSVGWDETVDTYTDGTVAPVSASQSILCRGDDKNIDHKQDYKHKESYDKQLKGHYEEIEKQL